MFFCLRVDLDYVPWDTPDAQEFGHGEPATVLRMLEMARFTGYKYHFFASLRVLRAFPSMADAVLNDGHALDWLCKHAEDEDRFEEAVRLLESVGNTPRGFAYKGAWPSAETTFDGMDRLSFLCADPGPHPAGLRFFPVETRIARESFRSGMTGRSWTDAVKTQVRDAASRNRGAIVVVRPQVLAKFDPYLSLTREILDLSMAVGLEPMSLRDLM